MDQNDLYSFVFRGLLTENALDNAGRKTKLEFSEAWQIETTKRLGILQMDEELVAKSKEMAIVYTAICAFENSVREFIANKLLEEKGVDWWEKCVKKQIRDIADDRKKNEKDVRWLIPRGKSMIYYTDFGHLVSIMSKPANWTFFEPHIGNKDWAKQIISTLEKSRNIIMHSGELAPTDIERVGMFIRDWIRQVG